VGWDHSLIKSGNEFKDGGMNYFKQHNAMTGFLVTVMNLGSITKGAFLK
jgi:hypothetical protein